MITTQSLRQQIQNDWDGTGALPMALHVYDALIRNHTKYTDGPIDFWKLSPKSENSEEDLGHFINYLADPQINLIKVRYEYFDGLNIHELSADDLIEAQEIGGLVHPISGTVISSYEKDVTLTFILNSNLDYNE